MDSLHKINTRPTQQSYFIESAYSHDIANHMTGDLLSPVTGSLPATLTSTSLAETSHGFIRKSTRSYRTYRIVHRWALAGRARGDSFYLEQKRQRVSLIGLTALIRKIPLYQ